MTPMETILSTPPAPDGIQPFPSFSEGFLHALEELGAKVPAAA